MATELKGLDCLMNFDTPLMNLNDIGVHQVLDHLADGTYVTDVHRRIVFWSQAAARITGWQGKEVVGRTCFDNVLVHVDKDGHRLCGEEQCPLHRAITTAESSRTPLLVFAQHKQGHRIPVEVSVSPLRDATGTIVGGIEVFRDLTAVMDDLRRARAIQDQTLQCVPPTDPRLEFDVRYTAEEVVSGDFYRVERVDEDRYAVMVADVMGHGVAAALYTMQLRSLWEECRAELDSPGPFMGSINRRLHRLLGGAGSYATAVYVLLNAATGDVQYIRAGHPAPLIFGVDGRVVPLAFRSPGLGLFPEAVYREQREHLDPGEVLLLYTDAAVEVISPAGEEFGPSAFQQWLQEAGFPAGKIGLQQIELKLLEFSGHLRLEDDLTLLSLRRTRPGA